MRYDEIIGTLGVGLILLAYFLNTFNIFSKDGETFFLLNIAGSALACYASYLIHYWPFVILEATWCLVSIIALVKHSLISQS